MHNFRTTATAAALMIAGTSASALTTLADFETSLPSGFFSYSGGATALSTSIASIASPSPHYNPSNPSSNGALEIGFTVGDFGGLGASDNSPQNWSSFDGISFWFLGSGSGLNYQFEILDNSSDGSVTTSERWDYDFSDLTAGWKSFALPFSAFTRATDFQPAGAPNDGLTLTEMWGWALILPYGEDTVLLDDVSLTTAHPVPLPASLPLLLAGIGGLGLIAQRRRKAT